MPDSSGPFDRPVNPTPAGFTALESEGEFDPEMLPGGAGVTAAAARKRARQGLGFGGWVSAGFLFLLVLVVYTAQWNPYFQNPDERFFPVGASPSPAHPLGIDGNAHDILRQVVWGARVSLLIGLFAIVMGLAIGGTLGLFAGYLRGNYDRVVNIFFDVFLSVPALILALAFTQFLGNDWWMVAVALGLVSIPLLGRITRASTLTWSQRDFITAARAQGAGGRRIMVREVLPNVAPAMFSVALLGIAVAIVAEGSLSILGAGVSATTITWGNEMNLGYADLASIPSAVLSPATAIFFTTLALNLLGDAIRKRHDAREAAL